jgi:hypothetical protein
MISFFSAGAAGLLFAMSPALLDEDQADRFADELYRITLFGPLVLKFW